jgi:hypothetical protein
MSSMNQQKYALSTDGTVNSGDNNADVVVIQLDADQIIMDPNYIDEQT